MRVKRIICPSCKAERKVIQDEDNLHEYSEEVVQEVCSRSKCQRWYGTPEQNLLRAIFGKDRGYTGKQKLKGGEQ